MSKILKKKLKFPAQYNISEKVNGNNSIFQLSREPCELNVNLISFQKESVKGILANDESGRSIFISDRATPPPKEATDHLLVKRGSDIKTAIDFTSDALFKEWKLPHKLDLDGKSFVDWENYCEDTRNSWVGRVRLVEELRNNGELVAPGLRPPQLGAIYSILSHWTVSAEAATIAMPTGTGKTDTMLMLFLLQRLHRVLVIVPTDALRDQTASKFITLGFFKKIGLVAKDILYPVVGILRNIPKSVEEVDEVFRRSNIIITTMAVAGQSDHNLQKRMAELCSHLFVDEAHHIPASTWSIFRSFFANKYILQFTATPFRNDGKLVEGKVIYCYPLSKAQAEGYFRPIRFKPVLEYIPTNVDREIAKKAIEQLEKDLENNFDHLIMARVSNIGRTVEIISIYQELGDKYKPVVLHSKIGKEQRDQALKKIFERQSRIIVCVDMLGEGFDLPELKIAAIHDAHKSLAITLQFTGRFTRVNGKIGDATVVTNTADPKVEESLIQLYAEDADWNLLLSGLSDVATEKEIYKGNFLREFSTPSGKLAIQNIFPKMSTVVFHTSCDDWHPNQFRIQTLKVSVHSGPHINKVSKVLICVTKEIDRITWGTFKDLMNTEWHLYLVYWNKDQKLLYINSSNTSSEHLDIARSIAGNNVNLVKGEKVFRALHGFNRLMLTNLGLTHVISRSVRFSMHAGSDVVPGLTEAHGQNKTKSNLFARGYSEGMKASIGVSRKGRVWSHQVAGDISEWVEWCKKLGNKLNDNKISTDMIFSSLIQPKQITDRPKIVPIAVEWPEKFYELSEDATIFDFGNGKKYSMMEVELQVSEYSNAGPLRFIVACPDYSLEYEMKFANNDVYFFPVTREVEITQKNTTSKLSDVFTSDSPVIRYEDSSFQIHDELFELPKTDRTLFDSERMIVLDWSKTNIKRESQTFNKYRDSIQRRVIDMLINENNPKVQVIFDDDGKGEAADIVTVGSKENRIYVSFYHCKYSKSDDVGRRVEDLYEVCGQAQKSVNWRANIEGLLLHLLRRDAVQKQNKNVSRFELGDELLLSNLVTSSRRMDIILKIYIVQPGLSKTSATNSQKELLAATELYLKETYSIDFGVICND